MGVLAMVTGMAALPAIAEPPERSEEPIFTVALDPVNELVVFWNITRDDLCDWFAGGFVGPPPVQKLIDSQVKETGQGALVASFHETSTLELWNLDDPSDPQDPCSDTDGQEGAWAQGSATVTANDNDLDVSGTRRNSFGERGQGKVHDADGGHWHFSWVFRAQCSVDCETDFTLRVEKSNLHKIGK